MQIEMNTQTTIRSCLVGFMLAFYPTTLIEIGVYERKDETNNIIEETSGTFS